MVKIFTSQDVFIGEFDGMMTTEQLLSSGVPFSRIRKYVEDGTLIRLQRGIYITKEAMAMGLNRGDRVVVTLERVPGCGR